MLLKIFLQKMRHILTIYTNISTTMNPTKFQYFLPISTTILLFQRCFCVDDYEVLLEQPNRKTKSFK